MARKFKIGDVVEVIKQVGDIPLHSEFGKRCRGKVTDYNSSNPAYPYSDVRIKTGLENNFAARELKLVRRGKK